MIKYYKILLSLLLMFFIGACENSDYHFEYQDGYPTALADNWIAFEFLNGTLEEIKIEPYDMVTSLDPNHEGYLILDKLYNADIRVRAEYSDSSFYVHMGEQLEDISTNNFNVEYVTIDGYITENPILTNYAFDLANGFFDDLDFTSDYISDVLFLRAGLYDKYKARVDSILILAYRKTGFENIEY